MNRTFNLLFYVRKSKINSAGEAPIYLRITIDGKIAEISTKRTIVPSKWNSKLQKPISSSEDLRSLSLYLKTFEQKIYDGYHELLRDKIIITCEILKNKVLGKEEKVRSLIDVFQDHNDRMEQLIGKEFAKGTLVRYKTCLNHLKAFIKWKYNLSDINLKRVDFAFLNDFEFFLRTEKSCNNNSAVKYIKNFGKIIRICLAHEWMQKDPFINYHSKFDEVTREFLNEGEIEKIKNKDFRNERLSLVRDIFLFSCFTGLAYIDTQKLTHQNITTGLDGSQWIYTKRQKTKITSNIPLLVQAENIINKYKDHPLCIIKGKLLPVLSNQKMNAYLKEIADLCGINKELTYHIARHTFATTVTLSNGVPIESVSKMLGHKSIKTTQHYAKILDKKVSEDMMNLKQKFTKRIKE